MARTGRITAEQRIRRYKDHRGREYTVVGDGFRGPIVKLGFQVYCLGTPSPSPEVLGTDILYSRAMGSYKTADGRHPRIDVFSGFDSVEECMEHHRREKEFRREATKEMRRQAIVGLSDEEAYQKLTEVVRGREPLPHLVPSWFSSKETMFHDRYDVMDYDLYRSWILVMPEACFSWEDILERGMLLISFDYDAPPYLEVCTEDLRPEQDTLLEGETDGWVEVEKTHFEPGEPVRRRLLCARDPRTVREGKEEKTPGCEGHLDDGLCDATRFLCDDVYRLPSCDGCAANGYQMHEDCELELTEAVFDEDGRCIPCRGPLFIRRRSSRIAARTGGTERQEDLAEAIRKLTQ